MFYLHGGTPLPNYWGRHWLMGEFPSPHCGKSSNFCPLHAESLSSKKITEIYWNVTEIKKMKKWTPSQLFFTDFAKRGFYAQILKGATTLYFAKVSKNTRNKKLAHQSKQFKNPATSKMELFGILVNDYQWQRVVFYVAGSLEPPLLLTF